MAPRHIRRIGHEALTPISCIRPEESNAWHLSAETIIEEVTNGTFREKGRGINAKCRGCNSRSYQRGPMADLMSGRAETARPVRSGPSTLCSN